jgi:hypothetical protein
MAPRHLHLTSGARHLGSCGGGTEVGPTQFSPNSTLRSHVREGVELGGGDSRPDHPHADPRSVGRARSLDGERDREVSEGHPDRGGRVFQALQELLESLIADRVRRRDVRHDVDHPRRRFGALARSDRRSRSRAAATLASALSARSNRAIVRAILRFRTARVTGGCNAAPAIAAGRFRLTPRRASGDDGPAAAPPHRS